LLSLANYFSLSLSLSLSLQYVLRRANGYFVDASYGFERLDTFDFKVCFSFLDIENFYNLRYIFVDASYGFERLDTFDFKVGFSFLDIENCYFKVHICRPSYGCERLDTFDFKVRFFF